MEENPMLKVGINGFGRIGRAIFRINLEKKYFKVVAINDINPSNENLAYLLKYDSIYGRLDFNISSDENTLFIEDCNTIKVYHKAHIDAVPWNESDVDLIIDASGIHNNLVLGENIKKQNVKANIITHAPDNYIDKTIIFGVNEDQIDLKTDFMISSSICDAVAFSPLIHALNNEFGVDHGFLTTLHPWLNYQCLLDGPSRSFAYPGTVYSNFALGRASTNALIPKTTSCIRAASKVLDYLNDKFQSLSYRVPTPIVSSADISVKLNKKTSKQEVIEYFKEKQKRQTHKIFYNNFESLVSVDFIKSEYSAIIDHRWTNVNVFNYLKLILWYDNEWGYSCRVVDLVKMVEEHI